MDISLVWKVLEIEETKDTDIIKNAYHNKLKSVNPEDDQIGFMKLREAYENALAFADCTEESTDDTYEALKDGSEIDQFIYRMNIIYENLEKRIDEKVWDELLNSYEDDLDGELQERVLAYFLSHHQFPMRIWKKLDLKFNIIREKDLLKEKFPVNFLEYMNYYITHDEFIDFDLFDGNTTKQVDEYISRFLDNKSRIDQLDPNDKEAVSEISHEFDLLSQYDLYHPYTDAERLHFLHLIKDESNMNEEALALAESLSFDYSDNSYICYYCGMIFLDFGKTLEAKGIFETLLEEDENNYLNKMGLVKTLMQTKEYESAKEHCLDLMDTEFRSQELNHILDEINEFLAPEYEAYIKENSADCAKIIDLGWCYFQQQRFKEVNELIAKHEKDEYDHYDYVNLVGRNNLAMDQYDKALDDLVEWRKIIDETTDDGTTDSRKKLNRKAFSHFAVGLCHWNIGEKELGISEIKDGIELEKSIQYKLSYFDQLVSLYLLDHSYQEAFDTCYKILEIDENFYPAYLRRQEAAFYLHKGQCVIDDFYNCKKLYDGFAKPYIYAMRVFNLVKQYDDSLNIYKQAKEANIESDELTLFYYKTMRYASKNQDELRELMRGFYKFEVEYIEKLDALKENPELEIVLDIENEEELFVEDALYRMALDDYKTALLTVEKGLQRYTDNISLLEIKGDILWELGQKDDAYICYQKLLSLNVENYDLYLMIGKYHFGKSNNYQDDAYNRAFEHFQKAYEIMPDGPENLYYLGRMYRKKYIALQQGPEKDDALNKLLMYVTKLYSTESTSFNCVEMGLAYEIANDYEKALSYFLEGIHLDSNNVYAHNNAGNIYLKLGRFDEAERELQIAEQLENDQEPTLVYEHLVELYRQKKNWNLAIKYAKKQLKRRPRDRFLLEQLADFYEALSMYRDVIETYHKLFDFGFIKRYELCYDTAKYYYLDGKKVKAFKLYYEALALTKNNPDERAQVIDSRKKWKE